MQQYEKIKAYAKIENGKTVCICLCAKRCDNCTECSSEIVSRDRFRGWKGTMERDRYGR